MIHDGTRKGKHPSWRKKQTKKKDLIQAWESCNMKSSARRQRSGALDVLQHSAPRRNEDAGCAILSNRKPLLRAPPGECIPFRDDLCRVREPAACRNPMHREPEGSPARAPQGRPQGFQSVSVAIAGRGQARIKEGLRRCSQVGKSPRVEVADSI